MAQFFKKRRLITAHIPQGHDCISNSFSSLLNRWCVTITCLKVSIAHVRLIKYEKQATCQVTFETSPEYRVLLKLKISLPQSVNQAPSYYIYSSPKQNAWFEHHCPSYSDKGKSLPMFHKVPITCWIICPHQELVPGSCMLNITNYKCRAPSSCSLQMH